MNRKVLTFFLLLVLGFASHAQRLNIGLFYREKPRKIHFTLKQGKLAAVSKGQVVKPFYPGAHFTVSLVDDSMELRQNKQLVMRAQKLKLLQAEPAGREALQRPELKQPPRTLVSIPGIKSAQRKYDNGFKLRVADHYIQLVNFVDFTFYLAGVVEAESGYQAGEEFYKAQAVLARTYAYKNILRHEVEGFNLCDRVHCQAYHGRTDIQPLILEAVEKTSFEVATLEGYQLIDALFSANCGGETANPKQIWYSEKPYLQAVSDPYCRTSRQATWTQKISLTAWKNYLRQQGWHIPDNAAGSWFRFKQEHRRTFYKIAGQRISFHQLRKDWELRSSFFSVLNAGAQIILKGKGYGHGVGLCQEGAMEMAERGKDYLEILGFYFRDIEIKRLTIDDVVNE